MPFYAGMGDSLGLFNAPKFGWLMLNCTPLWPILASSSWTYCYNFHVPSRYTIDEQTDAHEEASPPLFFFFSESTSAIRLKEHSANGFTFADDATTLVNLVDNTPDAPQFISIQSLV